MSRAVRLALVVALLAASPAWSATDADLAEIRSQLKELKDAYEARVRALEERLRQAEERAAPASAPLPAAPLPAPSAPNAFNPAISAILAAQNPNRSPD